jgi:Glycosyltransferase like family
MFSVIICSIDANRFAAVKAMYQQAFQTQPWELIHIEDARSLAEGYTRGITQSRGDLIILSHDDIDIFSPQMPQRLERHLSEFDVVGVLGTTLLTSPAWFWAGPPYLFGQVANSNDDGRLTVEIFGAPSEVVGDIQAIDGLFMAARRTVFSRVGFDAVTFNGFHFYDLDFSYSAFRAGLRVAVANDICIHHASRGTYDERWVIDAKKFMQKWFPGKAVPQQRFQWTGVVVENRAQALAIMMPRYSLDPSNEKAG